MLQRVAPGSICGSVQSLTLCSEFELLVFKLYIHSLLTVKQVMKGRERRRRKFAPVHLTPCWSLRHTADALCTGLKTVFTVLYLRHFTSAWSTHTDADVFSWSGTVWSAVWQRKSQNTNGRNDKRRLKRRESKEVWSRRAHWTSLLPVCVSMGTSDRRVSGFSLFHCGLWQLINTSREESGSSGSWHSYERAWGLSYCNFPSDCTLRANGFGSCFLLQ